LFESVDLLCGPLYGDSIELVVATNFTGHPGLTLRVGFNEMPTRTIFGAVVEASAPTHRVTQNIAIHGRLFEEGKMLALARAIEERANVWRERPPSS
jgi:Asp-tRNA(Asn)/Glu-tRNA(Gln) amidotransferase A subunit family amidase